MSTPADIPELQQLLLDQGGDSGGAGEVQHFGDPEAEWVAALQIGVVVPLPKLIRIEARGNDRSRFLHNFCTGDVSGMVPGQASEVFFTNVKARILAHGWILAGEQRHEIWMLPGDEERLLNHLSRYIITEDVILNSRTSHSAAFAVIGPAADSASAGTQTESRHWNDEQLAGATVRALNLCFRESPLRIISCAATDAAAAWSELSRTIRPAGMAVFHRQRILERFPLVGRDISDDHLAPEAGRTSSAISFTKGCYLGQEPIARIDALGRINQVLATVEAREELSAAEPATDVTSWSDFLQPPVGLAILRTSTIPTGAAVVRTPAGTVCSAGILSPSFV